MDARPLEVAVASKLVMASYVGDPAVWLVDYPPEMVPKLKLGTMRSRDS